MSHQSYNYGTLKTQECPLLPSPDTIKPFGPLLGVPTILLISFPPVKRTVLFAGTCRTVQSLMIFLYVLSGTPAFNGIQLCQDYSLSLQIKVKSVSTH